MVDSSTAALAALKQRSLSDPRCPVRRALGLVEGKWRLLLIGHLLGGTRRYGELRGLIPDISEKMLIQELRALEAEGVVRRVQYAEVPPRVEYSLTDAGRDLERVIGSLLQWGLAHPPVGAVQRENG